MISSVLIVDSNPDGLEMYLTALEIEGFDTRSATSGSEALEVLLQERPRAVVTELRLPGMPGIELIQRVRQAQPDAYIVGLASDGPDEGRGRDAGCDVVLPVPCLPETLIQELRRGLS
jgi:CheY-like chemotaxis protein